MGVDRLLQSGSFCSHSFPHTRGGGPSIKDNLAIDKEVFPTRVGVDRYGQDCRGRQLPFSPHAWGWTELGEHYGVSASVFPTRVGVDRNNTTTHTICWCFPHTRGGGPIMVNFIRASFTFSPHAWGWTALICVRLPHGGVFPTRVGVDRHRQPGELLPCSFPHTRGGGPAAEVVKDSLIRRFPHTRGGGPP